MRTNNLFYHYAFRFSAFVISGLLLALVACSFREHPEQSIFTAQPCASPCWYGIIAGETKQDDLITLLKQNRYVASDTIKEFSAGSYEMPHGTKVIAWDFSQSVYRGGVFISDDIVKVIFLDVESHLTLGDLIKQFNEPRYVQVMDAVYPWNPASGGRGEQLGYNVRIHYPERGLVFFFPTKPLLGPVGTRASIQMDWITTEVYIFPRGAVSNIISIAKQFKGKNEAGAISRLPLQAWHGLGDYDISNMPYP